MKRMRDYSARLSYPYLSSHKGAVQYALETLDLVTVLLMLKGDMDIPYDLEKALPFISCVMIWLMSYSFCFPSF